MYLSDVNAQFGGWDCGLHTGKYTLFDVGNPNGFFFVGTNM